MFFVIFYVVYVVNNNFLLNSKYIIAYLRKHPEGPLFSKRTLKKQNSKYIYIGSTITPAKVDSSQQHARRGHHLLRCWRYKFPPLKSFLFILVRFIVKIFRLRVQLRVTVVLRLKHKTRSLIYGGIRLDLMNEFINYRSFLSI